MAWAFEVVVDDPATQVAAGYTTIRVYRSTTGPTGTFALITPATAITLAGSTYLYNVIDATGKASYWYKTAFYGAVPVEDTQSAAMLGGMVSYCKVTDLKTALNDGQSTTSDDQIFIRHVQTASSIISEYCGRHFEQRYETRYFSSSRNANSPRGYNYLGLQGGQVIELLFDDLVSVTTLVCDYSNGLNNLMETLTEGTDFWKTRYGGGDQYRPFNQLEILSDVTHLSGYFPRGYRSVRVTGVWGWPANQYDGWCIPRQIQEVAIEIASRLYKAKDNAYSGVVGQGDISGSQFPMREQRLTNREMLMLDNYRRRVIIGTDSDGWSTERA